MPTHAKAHRSMLRRPIAPSSLEPGNTHTLFRTWISSNQPPIDGCVAAGLIPPFLRFSQRPTRYLPVLDHLQTSIAELHASPERAIRILLQTLLVLRSSRHQQTVRSGEIGSTGVTATRIESPRPAQLLVSFTFTVCGISEQQMARPTTIRLA